MSKWKIGKSTCRKFAIITCVNGEMSITHVEKNPLTCVNGKMLITHVKIFR